MSWKNKVVFHLCLICLGLLPLQSALAAATLHAILLGDTEDLTLGRQIQKDLDRVETLVYDIADSISYTLNPIVIQGKMSRPEKLSIALSALEIAPEDIVIFYVSSHGFRVPSIKSEYPLIHFSLSDEAIDFGAIVELIREKNPRFLLSIADVCNDEWPDEWQSNIKALHKRLVVKTDLRKANYKRLFLSSRGALVVCAAVPGDFAWSTPKGAVFTREFIEELDYSATHRINLRWERLLERTAQAVQKRTARAPQRQHPFFEILP